MGQLRAGVARIIVTPPLGTCLIGYADRSSGCKSVHDDLTSTAVVLDDGSQQLVIVGLDMLVLNEQIVARVRAGIRERWCIPPEHVMVCCSHTHSGPIAYAGKRSRRRNRRFIDGLVDRLVTVVGKALAGRSPAALAWGRREATIAVNRRQVEPDGTIVIGVNPDGPVDRSLDVLQVRRVGDGQPLAHLVNFACHATTLGPASYAVSADWPGAMRREVEASLGGLCLFIQGATGNLNPDHEWGDDDLDVMEKLGHQVAGTVIEIAALLEPVAPTPLRSDCLHTWLAIVPQVEPDGNRPITYRRALAREAGVPRFLVDPILNARYPWKTMLERRDGQWHTPMEIQVFRLGDCVLVAHAAETFNEIGVAIKAGSPVSATLFAGYSNGCIGYLPTADAHGLGGYEVALAPYFYRMPGLLDPGCEALVTHKSLEILQSMWDPQ